MASRDKRRQRNQKTQQARQVSQRKPPVNKPVSTIQSKVEELSRAGHQQATEADLLKVGDVIIPDNLTPADLAALYKQTKNAMQLLELQQGRLSTSQAELEKESHVLEAKKAEFAEKLADLERQKTSVENLRTDLEEKQKSYLKDLDKLAQDMAALAVREENAKTGFQQQFQDVYEQVKQLNSEFTERQRQELKNQVENLERLRQSQEEFIQALYQQHEKQMQNELQRLEASHTQIDLERAELDQEIANNRRDRKNLDRDLALLNEDQKNFEELVAKQVDKDTTRLQDELKYFKERFKEAEEERQTFQRLLIKWDETKRRVGKDADAILTYVEEMEGRISALQEELSSRPTQQDMERLQLLEAEKGDLEDKCFRLGRELEEHRHKLAGIRIGAIEHEDLHKLNLTLEASRKDLLKELDDLRKDIESKLDKESSSTSPFPQCYAFDQDPVLQEQIVTEHVQDLNLFASDVQMRIANSVGDRPGLFYKDRDIRSFIGGLAMSRTMVLQGISGTGKTSLAVAFAEVVGGGREVIEVQAGWRDRDDLIGHYNSFEKKFYEKKFLQALYRAQCPAFADRIFIILLDEMNLSYPEQYFADLLSALQMTELEDRKIDLIPQAPPSRLYPRAFINENRSIQIPDNVWFIGTANRDETTKDVADKTYDRSHILELPVQHPQIKIKPITTSAPMLSVAFLRQAFTKAQKDQMYMKEVEKAWRILEKLRPTFAEVGVGWGNRMKGQLEAYLPVVRACGGSWEEATDDLLATKILRKIRDRFEILPGDLKTLLSALEKGSKEAGLSVPVEDAFTRSIEIIEQEDTEKRRRMQEERA